MSRFSPSSQSPRQRLKRWANQFHPLKAKLQRDPMLRLETVTDLAIAADLGVRIDANQATVDDWLRLPGLSIHQARTLVTLSHSGVVFYSVDDVAAALGLAASQLAALEPILQFCYYDAASPIATLPPSLNQATIAQLLALPGMSSPMAERILNERQRSPFTNWSDVHHRLRLTAAQTSQWMHYLRI
ncbi:helix-hairpin-helix domain-containing protein [Leptolyngbya iicbica]|uniref:ComEA family DNA-binding protein n=2 Tax=Cyanophyceae TaxID=3028117 RepID=A0A4Q7E8U9_9CYAN|nr:helix-hairpin-helix domain-containing protein [Leptolyngbya sp. LK]RZM79247.1 ComEA family DNA-binding protein [Leptolyngbya sp. LK]